MDRDRWEEIQRLFGEAVELGTPAREALLRRVRRRDERVHDELVSLLDADRRNVEITGSSLTKLRSKG
jgi:hypothetical protein